MAPGSQTPRFRAKAGRRRSDAASPPSFQPSRPQQPPRVGGSPEQKQAQWLSRAEDAARNGDPVEAEFCRQHAEHWYRVSRGQS
ncbi:DUF4167 domain-containing protein [Azospirillum agricola]|uniref:DUF4167 domain-containing protein n=1 Tax=Azospirillum agricola TaxID=1720247 RepID=UPI000A0F2661|nr:DUF4167 domain-containing protein [Azospirillum agricola]MBP2227932.1 hypothetical protein [Azospirillum agricola]SMH46327.1 protein of unknown function [Azospirillum lipoferum]